MWPEFNSWTRHHMWVEFVVGSRPCSEGFSPGSPVFLPPQKSTLLNSSAVDEEPLHGNATANSHYYYYYYYYYYSSSSSYSTLHLRCSEQLWQNNTFGIAFTEENRWKCMVQGKNCYCATQEQTSCGFFKWMVPYCGTVLKFAVPCQFFF